MLLTRKVRIKLDGGNEQTFYAGAVISGRVEYRSPAADLLHSLNLVFRGVSKVLADAKVKQCEHIELFHHTQILLPQPLHTVANKPYEWAFTFHVPHMTGPDRSAGVYADGGNELFDEDAHHLPPYLDSSQSGSTRIEYHMYAIASRTCINVSGAASSWEEPTVDNIDSVPFIPDVQHVEQRQQSYEQTFAVHPPLKRRFSRRGSSIGDVSQTPLHSVQLEVNVPSMIILGEMLSIQFRDKSRVAAAGLPTNTLTTPPCSLKTAIVTLHALTHRRTAKTAYNTSLTEKRSKGLSGGHSAKALPLDGSFQTKRFSTTAVKAWPPSFKSYSIARTGGRAARGRRHRRGARGGRPRRRERGGAAAAAVVRSAAAAAAVPGAARRGRGAARVRESAAGRRGAQPRGAAAGTCMKGQARADTTKMLETAAWSCGPGCNSRRARCVARTSRPPTGEAFRRRKKLVAAMRATIPALEVGR